MRLIVDDPHFISMVHNLQRCGITKVIVTTSACQRRSDQLLNTEEFNFMFGRKATVYDILHHEKGKHIQRDICDKMATLTDVLAQSLCSIDIFSLHTKDSMWKNLRPKSMSNLMELTIQEFPHDYGFIESMPKLIKLKTSQNQVNKQLIEQIGKSCPALQELDLSLPSKDMENTINDDCAEGIKMYMSRLKKLSVSSTGLTNVGVYHISRLEHLEKLCLCGCHRITHDVIKILGEGDCNNLSVLDISDIRGIEDPNEALILMDEDKLHLLELAIQGKVNDNGIKSLIRTDIKTLKLLGPFEITARGASLLAKLKLERLIVDKYHLGETKEMIGLIKKTCTAVEIVYIYHHTLLDQLN